MAPPNTQPALPAEGLISDLEALFIDEQPKRLFPTNQNSNFGAVRKVLTGEMQDVVDVLAELYNESFITTALGYLGLWEDQAGLPKAVAGYSTAHRRSLLLSRFGRGAFTRARRQDIVESFITDTFGPGSDFGTGGLVLDSGGVPMYSGINSLAGTYTIIENVEGFSYEVRISNGISVDTAGLTRELTWITPAGISFSITTDAPASYTPTAPSPPAASNYTVPGGAVTVSTISQLQTELAKGTAEDIYVLNGTYSRTAEIVPGAAHRIWGQSPTGVVFNFGIRWNNMTAWEIHGVTFDIPDAAHAATDGGFTAAILNWLGNTTINGKITDCYINGHFGMAQGIQLGQPGGMIVQRCDIQNVTMQGIRASDNNAASTVVITTITDLNVAHVYNSTRGNSNGTGEAGVWIGHRVTNPVTRLKIRDIGWMGIWTGNAAKTFTISHFDIDTIYGVVPGVGTTTGTGVYVEAWTSGVTLDTFWIGHEFGDVVDGIKHEWDHNKNVALNGAITLPAATIPVKAPFYTGAGDAFPTSGTIYINETSPQVVTYTGVTGGSGGIGSFTGCSGGTGTVADGKLISTRSGGYQASTDVTMTNGFIRAASSRATGRTGIFLDKGTIRPTIQNVKFSGMDSAAIHDRTGTPQATGVSTSSLVQSGNDFTDRAPGAGTVVYG